MHGACLSDPTREQLGWDKRACMRESIVRIHEHMARGWVDVALLEGCRGGGTI